MSDKIFTFNTGPFVGRFVITPEGYVFFHCKHGFQSVQLHILTINRETAKEPKDAN